jgi:hypothetical protein
MNDDGDDDDDVTIVKPKTMPRTKRQSKPISSSYRLYPSLVLTCVYVLLLLCFLLGSYFVQTKPIVNSDVYLFPAFSIGCHLLIDWTKDRQGLVFGLSLCACGCAIFFLSLACNDVISIQSSLLYNGTVVLSSSVTRIATTTTSFSTLWFDATRGFYVFAAIMECIHLLLLIYGFYSWCGRSSRKNETVCFTPGWRWKKCTRFMTFSCGDCASVLSAFIRVFCLLSLLCVVNQLVFIGYGALNDIPYWTYNESIAFPLIIGLFMILVPFVRENNSFSSYPIAFLIVAHSLLLVGWVFLVLGVVNDSNDIQAVGATFLSTRYYAQFNSSLLNFGGFRFNVTNPGLTLVFGQLSIGNHIMQLCILIFSSVVFLTSFIWAWILHYGPRCRRVKERAKRAHQLASAHKQSKTKNIKQRNGKHVHAGKGNEHADFI